MFRVVLVEVSCSILIELRWSTYWTLHMVGIMYNSTPLMHTVKVTILGSVIFSVNGKRHHSVRIFRYYVLWTIKCAFIRIHAAIMYISLVDRGGGRVYVWCGVRVLVRRSVHAVPESCRCCRGCGRANLQRP